MILKKKYIDYLNNFPPLCFHCLEKIGEQEQRVYEIRAIRVKLYLPVGTNQMLMFHEECFRAIAGEKFIIEEIKNGKKEKKI